MSASYHLETQFPNGTGPTINTMIRDFLCNTMKFHGRRNHILHVFKKETMFLEQKLIQDDAYMQTYDHN